MVLSSGEVRGVYTHTGFLLAIECLPVPIVAAADLFRAAGKATGETRFVAGLRFWF